MSNFDSKDIVRVVQDYTGYIASSCRRYYIIGGTTEDLFQEGVIGLLEACKNYKGESLFEPKFDAFAKKCKTTCAYINAIVRGKKNLTKQAVEIFARGGYGIKVE